MAPVEQPQGLPPLQLHPILANLRNRAQEEVRCLALPRWTEGTVSPQGQGAMRTMRGLEPDRANIHSDIHVDVAS
jgi:hypothetical protein